MSKSLMTEQVKAPPLRNALIGFLGTLLTVCGGLSGALVTSAATVYQVQRQNQKISLPSSDGNQILKVVCIIFEAKHLHQLVNLV